MNTEGREIAGDTAVEYLETTDGQRLQADVYIAATGVRPNIEFVQGKDLLVDEGILVNQNLETSRAGIFACGDVAQAKELLSGQRRVLGLSFPSIVAGRHKGEEFATRGKDWMRKFYVHLNRLQGFVLLGRTDDAGMYMRLLQQQRSVQDRTAQL